MNQIGPLQPSGSGGVAHEARAGRIRAIDEAVVVVVLAVQARLGAPSAGAGALAVRTAGALVEAQPVEAREGAARGEPERGRDERDRDEPSHHRPSVSPALS